MADQNVNDVNQVQQAVEQPQEVVQDTPTQVLPETPSVADMDPQSAIAAQGWEVIKNHPEVQKAISGEALDELGKLTQAAVAGDENAQRALIDHQMNMVMGTIGGPPRPKVGPLQIKTVTIPAEYTGNPLTFFQHLAPIKLHTTNVEEAKKVLNYVAEHMPHNKVLLNAASKQYNNLLNPAKSFRPKRHHEGGIVNHAMGGEVQYLADGGEVQSDVEQHVETIPLVNSQTNEIESVPHDQASELFATGSHNLLANQPVVLSDAKGNLVEVDPSEVYQSVTEGGYDFAKPSQMHEANMQAKYGEGALNAAKAFGAAAARTGTFGLSDVALTQSGLVNPETLQQLKERNPASSIAGDIAGIAGSLALGPETAVGRLAGLGKAAESAAARVLPETAGIASKIVNTAAAKGLGSAVEGLGYGAGNVVTEAALGDPNLNAQSAVAHIGLSGLLGGALGGVLGAGEIAIPEAVKAANEALGKIKANPITDMIGAGYDKAAAFVSGKTEADINLLRLNREALLKSPEETQKYASEMAKSYNDYYNELSKVTKSVKNDIRPAEIDSMLQQTDPARALNKFEDIRNELRSTINEFRAEPEIYSPSAARQLEKYEQRLLGKPGEITEIGEEGLYSRAMKSEEGFAGNANDAFKAIDDLKQRIDDEIAYGKLSQDPTVKRTQNVLRSLRSKVKDALEDAETWGIAGSRQAEYNEALSEFLRAKQSFEKNFGTKEITKSGAVNYKIDPVKINTYLKQLDTLRGDAKTDVLRQFQEASEKYLGQVEKSYASLPDREFNKEAINSVVDKVSKAQQEYLDKAEIENAAARLGAGDQGSGIGAVVAHSLGVPNTITGLYATMKSPLLTLQRLAKFERLVQKTTNAVSKGASSLFKSGGKSAEEISGYLGSKVASSKDNHEKISNEINDLHSNPEKLIDKLEQSTQRLQEHAGAHTGAMQTAAVNAIQFLKSKLPQPAPETPLGNKIPLTKTEINTFNKYHNAVENPTGVFDQMRAGLLTKEAVETLATVYPDLYNHMKQQVMENLVEVKAKGQHIPYQMKNQLSLFMGQDMDLSTLSKAIVSNQIAQGQAMAEKTQLDQGFIKPSAKALGNIDLSNRSLTASQSIGQRHSK